MNEPLDYVRCVFCKELIRWDAIKCKHCQSTVVPQQRPTAAEDTSKRHMIERPFAVDIVKPNQTFDSHQQTGTTKPSYLKFFWFWGLVLGCVGGVIVEISDRNYISLVGNIEAAIQYGLGWGLSGLVIDGFNYISKRRWVKFEGGIPTRVSILNAFHWSIWLASCAWFGRYVYLQQTEFGLHWAEYLGESAAWGLVALVIGVFIDFKRAQGRLESS